jgi:TetR/AcrR family transcriptional regulator
MGATLASTLAAAAPERVAKLALVEGLGPLGGPAESAGTRLREAVAARRALDARRDEAPRVIKDIDTALAARLQVSEAALYRHFASKAQMFEGLIEFIESSVFGLINQICAQEEDALRQLRAIVAMLLGFAQKNPGMTRVMVGDALVFEHERLTARMNQFFDRVESQLRQSLRAHAEATASSTPTVQANALASALVSFVIGRLQRYARSGFRRLPTEQLDLALHRLTA